MSVEVIQCPHCHARVVPMADGTCPACRKNTEQPPSPASEEDGGAVREVAWDRYQESLHPNPVERSITVLSEIEQPFTEIRAGTDALMRGEAGPDIAAADRIRQELLPPFGTAIEQIHQASEKASDTLLIAYAKTREESWLVLAEALAENNPEKLERHQELWERAEAIRRDAIRDEELSATPTPAKRVEEFQRALATFTPRLIATPAIVLANILVFATMVASGVHFLEPTVQNAVDWGANFGPRTGNGQWWRIVTCMFLHFGIVHLGFNMWVLWDLGRLVERLVGNLGFVALYFLSGIAGSLASLTWNPLLVSGGASGAVFGVVGALLGLIAFRRDTIPVAVLKHLWKSVGAFLVYNMVFGIMVPGIDMAAHIGGLVAGFACGLILSQPLSVEMVVQRRLRNAVVSVGGIMTLLLWAVALPNIPLAVPPPSCTDPGVVKLLDQVIQSALVGTNLKSVDSHRELSYDANANVRHGECVAHTNAGEIPVRFMVEWQDLDKGLFQVRVPPADLPSCTEPEVVKLLEQVIQSTLVGSNLKSVDSYREVGYDSDADVRHGECVAHTDAGDVPIKFLVEWQDRNKGLFQVRIPTTELPSCTDSEVVKLLDQVIQSTLVGTNLKSVDSHREVSYDSDADVRHGECVAHTDAGDILVRFIVEWQDRNKGFFQVRTFAAAD